MKTYRKPAGYITISLTLDEEIIHILNNEVGKTKEKNMSKFIEELVEGEDIAKMPNRRKFKTFPIKKTFTFSKEFVSKIKKSGNMSLFIEEIIKNKFQ